MRRSMLARARRLSSSSRPALRGCVAYEYEHEFWLRVDGSGTRQRHRPARAVGAPSRAWPRRGPEGTPTREAARALFERSGLRVRRVTLTRRGGRPLPVRLRRLRRREPPARHAGLPRPRDLSAAAARASGCALDGQLAAPGRAGPRRAAADDGLMAVRFHLPSKVYEHKNALDGVERGNIVGWRQDVRAGARRAGASRSARSWTARSILSPRSGSSRSPSSGWACPCWRLGLVPAPFRKGRRRERRGAASASAARDRAGDQVDERLRAGAVGVALGLVLGDLERDHARRGQERA